MTTRQLSPRARLLWGLATALMGLFIVGVGLDWVPVDPDSKHAPGWVIALAGAVFVLGGLALIAGERGRLTPWLGIGIVLAFAAVGGWVALAGDERQMSGGIPFLPRETNVTLARWLFGGGAVICLLLGAYGIVRAIRGAWHDG